MIIFANKFRTMLERILPYETELFFLINGHHHPWLNPVMWLLSNTILLIPLIVFLVVINKNKNNKQIILPLFFALAFVFLLGDFFSSTVIKPNIQRLRPTHYPGIQEQVLTVYGYIGKKFGFLSGHATNSIGFATFSSLLFRRKGYSWGIYLWALAVCYSRVYLGVHFISDLVAGSCLGVAIGWIVYYLHQTYIRKVQPNDSSIKVKLVNGSIVLMFIVLLVTTLKTEGLI